MKYLLVFYLAGFFLANAVVIKKYKLCLEPKEQKFQGTVTLTLNDSNNSREVELDQYPYSIYNCTYIGTEPLKQPPTELSDDLLPETPKEQVCFVKGNKITFPSNRIGEEVVLKFRGDCEKDGLSHYKTESKDWFYVADMTAQNRKIIFPCKAEEKAEFEFGGNGVVMSNLDNLRGRDEKKEIFLRDLTFVQGDIVKDEKSVTNLTFYHMKQSGALGQKLKNVMENVANLDPSLKILFTPVKEEISIASRDVIILSNVDLKPDDSGSNYFHISQTLADKLFQRPKGEKKTIFDSVGPKFAAMKISNAADFPVKGDLTFRKIGALEADGFENSRSLNELVSKYENIEDSDLYTKGISVVHSLESICGNGNFRKGLSNYVRNGNSKVNEAFEGCFGNKDKAGEFFKAWTDYPGYPVVHVILNKPEQYYMNQERFLWLGSKQEDRRWTIPTDYETKEGSGENIMLPANGDNVTVTINSTYFILDHNNKGFYRVNYDAKLWEALISQLKSNHTAIDTVSRMKLINDVFSFPKSTSNFTHATPDYVTALKLSEYLKSETDLRALKVAFDALDFLDSALSSPYHGKFRDHMKSILDGIYEKTKKTENSELQNLVYLFACKYGVEECTKNATKTFNETKWSDNKLSELQKLAICSVVRNDSKKWVDSFVSLNAMGIKPEEKINLLGCSRDENILSLFLSQFMVAKDKEGLLEAVASAVNNNPDNIKVILNIIKRFEAAITSVFGKTCLQNIAVLTLPKLNSESAVTLKEISKDFDQPIKQAVDMACENVKLWTDTKAKTVGEYFKGSKNGSGSQAKPIALLLLATTLLPLANHIFNS